MIVSEARIAANRLNALRSTGPRTREGKDRSRENGLKHGFASLVVLAEDAEQFQERALECFYSLKPQNRFQADLVDQVALIQIRTERCQRIERNLRNRISLHAATTWDDDRRREAERLGRDLSARPSEVVAELARTPQGCDYLLERWAMLAHAAKKGWTGPQRRLAFDLLGTPAEFRDGEPGAEVDPDGEPLVEKPDQVALAAARIAALRGRRELAAEHDAIDRDLAEADLTDESTPEVRRLRRYESALHRRLRWTLERLNDPLPTHRPAFQFEPAHASRSQEEIDAEIEAEMRAKIEKDTKFEAEYYAKKAQKEAEENTQAEARARKQAERAAPAPTEPILEAPTEPIIPAPTEPILPAPTEPIIPAPTGPPIEAEAVPAPSGIFPAPATDRRDARPRQAESRRGAEKRKRERLRA